MVYINHTFIIPLAAFIAGTLSGVAGGSGIVILPLLLMAGVPPQLALGTNKLFTTATLFSSCGQFFKKKLFIWQHWIVAGIATLVGAIAGVVLAIVMPEHWMSNLLPILIAAVAIYSIIPHNKRKKQQSTKTKGPRRILKTSMASILGIYSGFFGAGTSLMWNTFIMRTLHVDQMEASAISRAMCFLSNIAALLAFMIMRDVDYRVGLALAGMGMLGAALGSKIALRLGPKLVKPSLFITTIAMAGQLAYSNWFA